MAKMMQIDTIDDVSGAKPEEFKAHYETIDGKKVLVIKANTKTITNPDGSKDVIISAPSLGLINEFNKEK